MKRRSALWRLHGLMRSLVGTHSVVGLALLGLVADVSAVLAQTSPPEVTLGREVQVSLERQRVPHFEPHISVNPRDPQHLLVASVSLDDDGTGLADCAAAWCSELIVNAAFVSFDGGGTWESTTTIDCDLDPWTAFDTAGTAYVSCLYPVESRMVVALHRSRDGGRSFTGPKLTPVGRGTSSDRPFLAVDTMSGPGSGSVYIVRGQWASVGEGVAWFAPSILRSVDDGESFLGPSIHHPNNLFNLPQGIQLLPDGGVAVVYVDWPPSNGDVSGPVSRNVYNFGFRDPRVPASRSWVFVSTDGGDTFGPPRFVAEHPVTAFAVDTSERFSGRWYVAMLATLTYEGGSWSFEDGGPTSVYVMHSDDSGESWSPPVRVSDGVEPHLVGRVMMAVNRDGAVGIAWYDSRNGSTADCYDIYLSVSGDGGDTFTANRRLSSVTSCQNVPGNVIADAEGERDLAARFPFGGDYSALAAGPDGRFHVVWADSRTGLYQLWTRSVTVAR
jgi:hypothetical protein